jgi:hypothetical protein
MLSKKVVEKRKKLRRETIRGKDWSNTIIDTGDWARISAL